MPGNATGTQRPTDCAHYRKNGFAHGQTRPGRLEARLGDGFKSFRAEFGFELDADFL